MKLKIYSLFLLIIFLLFTGCERIELGEAFEGKVGQNILIQSDLTLKIDSIRDYRCPEDVICIWGGDVDIHIILSKPFSNIDTLICLNNPQKNPLSIYGYSFRVNEVTPHPVSNRETPQQDFKISITVTKE